MCAHARRCPADGFFYTRCPVSIVRCIRCGGFAIPGNLFCQKCFASAYAEAVHEVAIKPIQSPYVQNALAKRLPVKEYAR